MKTKFLVLLFFISSALLFASDHGIYLMTNKAVKGDFEQIQQQITNDLQQSGFEILKSIVHPVVCV